MGGKKCCIENCNSSSTRKEDVGVTYHKFPKGATFRDIWLAVTLQEGKTVDASMLVCSRHFRKNDFQIYKDSKFILKSDAIPSIFPWIKLDNMATPQEETHSPSEEFKESENGEIALNDSNETEGENLQAIKKFIEEQEKEILQLEATVKPGPSRIVERRSTARDNINTSLEQKKFSSTEMPTDQTKVKEETSENLETETEEPPDVKEDVGTTAAMDVILSGSEPKRKISKSPKKSFSPGTVGNTMALAVGSKVEAKDFSELWYPAQIAEVDYDEMEVLVRYDNLSKKHDEWISVSSPRLRPLGSGKDEVPEPMTSYDEAVAEIIPIKEEFKKEVVEKPKLTFQVGERCLARWRDNRKFLANISEDLGDDQYKIKFDDGTDWQCSVTRLHKIRDTSPVLDLTPTVQNVPTAPLPYNTHLFDPTRDYLGSKSERRAMKRKLNIKEIFNIGQKRKREDTPLKKPRILRKKSAPPVQVKTEIKTEPVVVNEAVASIMGTPKTETEIKEQNSELIIKAKLEEHTPEIQEEQSINDETQVIESSEIVTEMPETVEKEVAAPELPKDIPQMRNMKVVLEKIDVSKMSPSPPVAEKDDEMEIVTIDINDGDLDSSIDDGDQKLDIDDLMEESILAAYAQYVKPVPQEPPKIEPKERITLKIDKEKLQLKPKKKKSSHEAKVNSKVEKVKNEIAEMKRRMEEMKKQSKIKSEQPFKHAPIEPLPESVLSPEQWCCRWVNGQPVGAVSELKGAGGQGLPRRSVQVEDRRLPPGWSKHMVRRSQGSSAGKWDVVIIGPDAKRFHNKTDMKNYLDTITDDALKEYEMALMDFGAHRKLSRRLGWEVTTQEAYETPIIEIPADSVTTISPLLKRKPSMPIGHKKDLKRKIKKNNLSLKRKHSLPHLFDQSAMDVPSTPVEEYLPPLEEGYIYVGSLKVQILENLLRCPADGCYKNFRNNTLLQMHVKHYHKQLVGQLGATPKVLDLASARTKAPPLHEDFRAPKVKSAKAPRYFEEVKAEAEQEMTGDVSYSTPFKSEMDRVPRSQDSPRLRNALINTKTNKRPKVLLPVRKLEEAFDHALEPKEENQLGSDDVKEEVKEEILDFESAISSHTVSKEMLQKKINKKKFASAELCPSDDDSSDFDGRSSAPHSGSPDKPADARAQLASSESNDAARQYMLTDSGEKIKIVHMKREEIINCHCGLREEDGLMIQCELCLCWQHALCHNILREAEVPDKYTCSICLNPRRGRRSRRFLHDQDRLYEGTLPGAAQPGSESLRRSHELSGNLLLAAEALHALRVKLHVFYKKDHPKLYLWAKDWDSMGGAPAGSDCGAGAGAALQPSDYIDLGALVRDLGKENLPAVCDDLDPDRLSQPHSSHLGSQALLSGLLSSPGGVSLDLPISTSELESLAKSVQESDLQNMSLMAPVPEAAIEDGACRARLLRHVQRCHALVDARLDSIEAQVAELESQDPSFEDDESAEYCPRTKHTLRMLLRDLDSLEELGALS